MLPRPPPLLQIGTSRPGVTLQPVGSFERYERLPGPPLPPTASLYPMHTVSHRSLPPSVELFPVALLRNGQYSTTIPARPIGPSSIPMYSSSGWNLRRGPASPADSPAVPTPRGGRKVFALDSQDLPMRTNMMT